MEITDFLEFSLPTFGISIATATWLAKQLVDHGLKQDLQRQKSELDARLAVEKTHIDANVREQVDTLLADRAADREYALEARKRLYQSIGPLRFQLLLACRDLAGRIIAHSRNPYDTDLASYYGKSFLYRLLRPLALSELIERQIAYADFSVDTGAIDLLRFKKAAFAAFTGGSLVQDHPAVDWGYEKQHIFFDNLSRAASFIIVKDGDDSYRCARFDEFEGLLLTAEDGQRIQPLPELMSGFSPKQKPLLWLRMVGYARLCTDFVNRAGIAIGFEPRELRCADLLRVSKDSHINENVELYDERCRSLAASEL